MGVSESEVYRQNLAMFTRKMLTIQWFVCLSYFGTQMLSLPAVILIAI